METQIPEFNKQQSIRIVNSCSFRSYLAAALRLCDFGNRPKC